MKLSLLKILSFVFILVLTGCYWHIRNASEVPSELKVLYLNTENVQSQFRIQLLDLMDSMHITLAKTPEAAPFTLKAYHYQLTHDNPRVATTNVGITYTYTIMVTVSITSADGKVIAGPRVISATRQITVNVNQIFTINSTSVFQAELQREAVNLIYYWLTSDEIRHLLESSVSHANQPTAVAKTPQR